MSTLPDLTGHGPGADGIVTLPDLSGYGFTPRGKHEFEIRIGPRIAVGHDHDHQIETKYRVSSAGSDALLFARWDIHRYGGCGIFQVVIGGDLTIAEIAANNEWEIEIWVRLYGEMALTLWYRGYVTTFWREKVKDRWQTTLQGLGYVGQLKRLVVDADYSDMLTDVIVRSLLDTYAVQATDPSSDIHYAEEDIDPGVSVANFRYTGTLVRALRDLAILQGGVEYGVSEERKFFWVSRDTSTVRHHLVERRNLIDIVQAGAQQKRSTSLTIEGKTTYKTVAATRSNVPTSPDQKQERIMQAAALSDATDLDNYAAGMLTEYDTAQEWLALRISEIQEAYHRATVAAPRPLGLYRVHFTDGSVKDYTFGKVIYRIGGDPDSPEGRRAASTLISAELWLGSFSKNLTEEVEELAGEVEQLRMKLRNMLAAPPAAKYVVAEAHSDLSAEVVLGSSVIMRGAYSLIPGVATVPTGALYAANDLGALYRNSGSITTGWEKIADIGGGGGVDSVSGTEDQVYVDGGLGPEIGDVTLSLPQDIATDSDVQFGSIGINAAAQDNVQIYTGGAFLASLPISILAYSTITFASAGTGIGIAGEIDFQTAEIGTHTIYQAYFSEPMITVNGSATVSKSATVRIEGMADEAIENHGLWCYAADVYIYCATATEDPYLLINQASSGDAAMRLSLGTTISYVFGIDNDVEGDPFVLSTAASGAAVLGTNNLLSIDSAGNGTITGSFTTTCLGVGTGASPASYGIAVLVSGLSAGISVTDMTSTAIIATAAGASPAAELDRITATTATIESILLLQRYTSDVAADGIGGSIDFGIENDAGNPDRAARICVLLTDASVGAEESAIVFTGRTVGGLDAEVVRFAGTGKVTLTGLLQTTATVAGSAGLNLPHGTAPEAPVNGDVWTTSAGMYVQIDGVTVGPLGEGGGGAPDDAEYLVLSADAGLPLARVFEVNPTNLTYIEDVTNLTYTLNTIQDIDETATPEFAGLGIGTAGVADKITLKNGWTVYDSASKLLVQAPSGGAVYTLCE